MGTLFAGTHTYDHPTYQTLAQQLLKKMRKQKRLTTTKSNAGTKCQQADDLVIFYKIKRKLGI